MENTLNNIINRISANYGIQRIGLRGFDEGALYRCFIKIANSLCQAKSGRDYDDTFTKPTIERILQWLYLIPAEGLEFRKGILLKGKTGCGKSFIFKVLSHFVMIDDIRFISNGEVRNMAIKTINAKRLASDFQRQGYEVVSQYSKEPCLLIDDIGTESDESKFYGNTGNIIDLILDAREEKNLLTFGTSNLEKMRDKYDDRLVSRMSSLFNIIPINHGVDYRK